MQLIHMGINCEHVYHGDVDTHARSGMQGRHIGTGQHLISE